MGKILSYLRFIVLVFSTDINENRRHVHVTNASFTKLAKFWIEKNGVRSIELCDGGKFTGRELREARQLILDNISYIEEQLHLFYEGNRINHKKINR